MKNVNVSHDVKRLHKRTQAEMNKFVCSSVSTSQGCLSGGKH